MSEVEVSKRKQYEMRTKKKKVIEAIKGAIDALTKKMESGEPLRDEDLRFLRHVFKDWRVLEESIIEEKEETLPEGKLKDFIDRVFKFKELGDWEEVAKKAGYYRCLKCGELHLSGKECIFDDGSKVVDSSQFSSDSPSPKDEGKNLDIA